MRATRVQADRQLYKAFIRRTLENQPNLTLFQQECGDLIVENGAVRGVVTVTGIEFRARAVVLTVGTFLGGRIHVGLDNYAGGRAGDPPSNKLAERLRALPFRTARLKTGTPPRIDGRTIDYSQLAAQHSDEPRPRVQLSRPRRAIIRAQLPCHITATTERTHEIIRAATDRSPMFTGKIEGVGPRYCPSVEDKVVRFADKTSHQIFIEPEGLNTHEVYPNGISTSLPYDVQIEFVRTIRGFENAHITRPGYAIEYDFFDPRDLKSSLETKALRGLFFAGQINGTTGYEEAAAQGLIAGINAARAARGARGLRAEAQRELRRRAHRRPGDARHARALSHVHQPRRTSPAAARGQCRPAPHARSGRELGLVDDERWAFFEAKRAGSARELARFRDHAHQGRRHSRRMAGARAGRFRDARCAHGLRPAAPARSRLRPRRRTHRPAWRRRTTTRLAPQIRAQLEVAAKYAGYIERQEEEIARQRRNEETRLPADLDYSRVAGLSNEVRQKLAQIRPATVGQAARVAGVTPAAVSILLVHLKKSARGLMARAITRRQLLLALRWPRWRSAPAASAGSGGDSGHPAILLRGNGPDPDSLDPHKARSTESMVVLRDLFEASRGSTRTPPRFPAPPKAGR